MTAAQRYNARYDAIWDDARKRGAFNGRSDLPGQLELPDTEPHPIDVAKRQAAAPLVSTSPQKPCNIGLFSDDAAQIDLIDVIAKR